MARVLVASLLVATGCQHAPPTTDPRPDARAQAALASDLDRIFNAAVMEHSLWGVEVKSLDSGRVLYARNAGLLMMPASNMKVVTLAAAAEILGWDYRFKTAVETAAPVEGGVLKGDLFVRGGGDPTINTRGNRAAAVFDEWAAALKAAGITRIDGGVIGDDAAFEDEGLGQGWSWDYLQDGYAAPAGALEVHQNIATLTIRPGVWEGDAAGLDLTPGSGLTVSNLVQTGAPQSATRISIDRHSHGAVIEVSGAIASDAAAASRDVAVVNPTVFFARTVKDALIARGIDVGGEGLDLDDVGPRAANPVRRMLIESSSPPLHDIASVMMKVSQNVYAETLLKAVGAARSGAGSTDAGRAASRDLFGGWGIAPDSYVQADGSGLSRYDFVTARMIVTLLERMHRDPRHREKFVATLPIAGKDGTIATRMKGTRAEANAVAKTGSIANVRTLSGYVRTRDGETLAFSILANNFTIPAATVNWIADLAVERLANHSAR